MPYEALGSDFRVNTTTFDDQWLPEVATLADGSFVIVWRDESQQGGDTSLWSVRGQHYAADGTPIGGEFLVNTTTFSSQYHPTVTGLTTGGFVVAWNDVSQLGGDSAGSSIKAQIYDSSGVRVGGEFLVNSMTAGDQWQPQVAPVDSGGFVIAWADYGGSDGDYSGIKAQIYDSSGTAIGGEFTVNTATGGDQYSPTISGLTGGGFVVAWSDGSGDDYEIRAQVYDSSGSPVGGEIAVNSQIAYVQSHPVAAGLAEGGFVIAWTDSGSAGPASGSTSAIKAQLFDSDGNAIGGEFLVSGSAGYDEIPSVAALANGDFIITWSSWTGSGSRFLNAQIYHSDGQPVGDTFLLGTNTSSSWASVTGLEDGGFAATWSAFGTGSDGSGFAVKAQIYSGSEPAQPADAQDDAFTTNELAIVTGNVFADNGSGADSDPDGPPLTIAAVNGDPDSVGTEITLPSGALLTVNADGSFSYDPNGAFEQTPTYGSGAYNTPSADTFSYTLVGGDSATVVFTIEGVDNNDTIFGSDDDNRLIGGSGNDQIFGLDGADHITGGNGDDLIDGGDGAYDRAGWYQTNPQLGGATVDLRITEAQDTGSQGWDTITGIENLSGTPFADTLTGDDNDNWLWGSGSYLFGEVISTTNNDTLDGQGGDDLLTVGGGNHTLVGGDGSDSVRYTENGGPEVSIVLDLNAQGAAQDSGAGSWTLTGIENLAGGDGDDELIGDGNSNVLAGAAGSDFLDGGAGNDRLYGDGTIAVDSLSTGPITEFPEVSRSVNDVADGNDVLNGGAGDDTLYGGGGNDTLTGGADNDELYGGNGNDFLRGNFGDDILDGGDGFDRIGYFNGSTSGITVDLRIETAQNVGEQGFDTITNVEAVSGTVFADSLIGNDQDNWLWGSISGGGISNNDYLDGQGGNDLLSIGIGNHTLIGGTGNDTLTFGENGGAEPGIAVALWENLAQNTGAGTWTLSGIENLSGGIGNDSLEGDDSANIIAGSLGNDALFGYGGNDTLYGDGAIWVDNQLIIRTEVDSGSAGGNDQLFGGGGNDILYGGAGNDFLQANAGNDLLYGGSGNDYVGGGTGDDLLDGGDGYDRASFSNGSSGPVTVDLRLQGSAQNTGLGMDTLIGIENVSATAFGDTLIGDAGDNWLWGGTDAAGITDTIDGQGGDDLIEDGVGNHNLSGGDGIDTFSFNPFTVPTNATISLALQGVAQDTGAGIMTLSGFENLSGSSFSDTLIGDANDNVIGGGELADTLIGGAGNDTLYGDGFFGTSSSPSGQIALFTDVGELGGIDGNDILEGGLGDDVIDGGGGRDTASYADAVGGVQVFLYKNGNGNGESGGADGFDLLYNIENITGSAFNDQLAGNNLDNVIVGGDGHDGLRGNGGNDSLFGGDGDDFLNGSAGDDYVDGGAGNDRAGFYEDAGPGGVTVDLNLQGVAQDTGQGMDTLVNIENVSGSVYGDTLIGDDNDNWLWGSASTLLDGTIVTTNNDALIGNGGNDLLIAGIGNHVIDGGSDTDTFRFTENGAPETGITLSLLLAGIAQDSGNGTWTLSEIENLSGSTANDSLTGDGNANVLAGDLGDDVLVGGGGNDTLYGDGQIGWDGHGTGGSGPITTWADATGLYVGAVSGNDILEGGLGDDVLNGGGGRDTASYEHASGIVTVTLTATGGSSNGADGNDALMSIENVSGGSFNDHLFGNAFDNILSGGGGHDNLGGGAGNDTLFGGAGNDSLTGGAGDDVIDGGSGYDRVNYNVGATAGVTVNLSTLSAQNTGQGIDTLIGIENVVGTTFDDVITGDGGDNWLWGGSLGTGVTGNDTISGGDGNDLIEVGSGNHNLSGAAGNDTLNFWGGGTDITSTGVAFNLATTTVQNTRQGWTTATGFENVSGSRYGDTLTGDAQNNVLAGNLGNDILSGGAGDDALYGDGAYTTFTSGGLATGPIRLVADASVEFGGVAGADTLNGGDGSDSLYGGGGNDTLKGDKGDDTLYGGSGNDSLVGGQGNDLYVIEGNSGADTITGFTHVDTIVFADSSGVTSFSQLTLTKVGGTNTLVSWGNGNSIMIAGFQPKDITAADFQFGSPTSFVPFSTQGQQRTLTNSTSDSLMIAAASGAALVSTTPITSLSAKGGSTDIAAASSGGTLLTGFAATEDHPSGSIDLHAMDTSGFGANLSSSLNAQSAIASVMAPAGAQLDAAVLSEPSALLEATQIPTMASIASTLTATGVSIPAAALSDLKGAPGGAMVGTDAVVGLADGAARLPAMPEGILASGTESLDAVLDALPGNQGPLSSLANLAHLGADHSAVWAMDGLASPAPLGDYLMLHPDGVIPS